ncbi:MAG: endospore germination permease [Bacillota bacterium]|nr:endospore germination permease [Bacillota bacterium]
MLERGKISARQLFFLALGFLHGNVAVFSRSTQTKEDIWAAALLAGVGGVLLVYLYTALAGYFPEETPSRYARRLLGRPLGTAVGLLYFWHALYVGALVLRSLGELMTINFYLQTPILVFALSTTLLTTFAVRPGIEVPARMAEIIVPFAPLLLLPLFVLLAVASRIVHLENLTPVLVGGLGPVLKGAWSFLAFPYGELVFFLFIFPALHVPAKARRAAVLAVILCSFYLILFQSLDVAVLGPEASGAEFFPSFIVATMIQIGEFLTRIEALVMVLWTAAIFVKLTVCQYVATLALAEALDLQDFHSLAAAVGALMIALSMLIFSDAPSLVAFFDRYFPFYSLPFYLLLPLLLWAVAKLRGRPGNPAPGQTEQTTHPGGEATRPAPPEQLQEGGVSRAL